MSEKMIDAEFVEVPEEIRELERQEEEAVKQLQTTRRLIELQRSPKDVLAVASEVSRELVGILKHRTDWIVNIEGRDYLTFPAYQFIGALLQLYPTVEWIRELKDEGGKVYGYEVGARVINRFGEVMTRAVGRADRNEVIAEYEWVRDPQTGKRVRGKFLGYRKRFDERVSDHVLMSIAQTRAMRRALAQLLSFVVGLAGYEPEPAEEREEVPEEKLTKPQEPPIEPKDWAWFWRNVRALGVTEMQVHEFFGVKSLSEILKTKKDLELAWAAIQDAVNNGELVPEKKPQQQKLVKEG